MLRFHAIVKQAVMIVIAVGVLQAQKAVPQKTAGPQRLSTYMREVGLSYLDTMDEAFSLPFEASLGLDQPSLIELKSLKTLSSHVDILLTRPSDKEFFGYMKMLWAVGSILKEEEAFLLILAGRGTDPSNPQVVNAKKLAQINRYYYIFCKSELETAVKQGQYPDRKYLEKSCPTKGELYESTVQDTNGPVIVPRIVESATHEDSKSQPPK